MHRGRYHPLSREAGDAEERQLNWGLGARQLVGCTHDSA